MLKQMSWSGYCLLWLKCSKPNGNSTTFLMNPQTNQAKKSVTRKANNFHYLRRGRRFAEKRKGKGFHVDDWPRSTPYPANCGKSYLNGYATTLFQKF